MESGTCGVWIVDNQGKQSVKVFIGVAHTFHSNAGSWAQQKFSVTSQIVNILVFAVYKVSLTGTQHCLRSSKAVIDNAHTNGHGCVPASGRWDLACGQ